MTDDGWVPVASAVALLNSRHVSAAPKVLRNTLNCCVDVRSRGVLAIDGIEPVALGPEQWSTMVFNLERQSLNPPSKRRIATGFTKVELLRSDVERLAALPALGEQLEEKEVEPEQPPRAKAGRKEKYDWHWVPQYLDELFSENGDPREPGQETEWNSDTAVADAVLKRFERHAKKDEETPSLGRVQNYIRPLLVKLRARNARK